MGLESFKEVDELEKKDDGLNEKEYYGLDGRLEMSDTEWLMKNELNERRSLFKDKDSSSYNNMSSEDSINDLLKRTIETDETDMVLLKTTGNAFKRIAEEHRKRFAEEMEKEKGRSK